MERRCIVMILASFALVACQETATSPSRTTSHALLSGAPSDGNGNKIVFPINVTSTLTCANGAVLTRSDVGWAQAHALTGGPNVELDVFHDVITFTNANGSSFVWRDVGPNRAFMQDGQLVIQVTGRADGDLGTFVIDAATGNVIFSAGPDRGPVADQACAALS